MSWNHKPSNSQWGEKRQPAILPFTIHYKPVFGIKYLKVSYSKESVSYSKDMYFHYY